MIHAAASDHRGTARLWLPPDDAGDRGVSSLVRRDIHARALDVPCLTLDSLNLRDVDFVKIDVDGNELAVLRGATALLARDRPALFIELESRIQPVAPVIAHLAAAGLRRAGSCPATPGCPSRPSPWRPTRPGRPTSSRRACCAGCFPREAPATSTRCSSSRTAAARARTAYATMDPMPPAKRPATPFTPLDFQLVLLRRMADHNPDLVEDARHELGVSIADMREANRRWQAMLHAPRSRAATSRYRSILGTPESVTPRQIGDLACEALLWPVPLWPDLRFEVLVAPNGIAWNEWLVRAPGVPGPVLETLDDLTPWSCTVDEAARAFAPARPLEGTAPDALGAGVHGPGHVGRTAGLRGGVHLGAVAAGGRQRAAVTIASATTGTDSGCSQRKRLGSTSSSSMTHGSPSSPSTRSTRA